MPAQEHLMLIKNFIFGLFLGLLLGYAYLFPNDIFDILLGSILSLIISKYYYTKAAEDLKEETEEVRSTLNIALLKLQNPDEYRVFLKNGKINAEVSLSANLRGSSEMTSSVVTNNKSKSKKNLILFTKT